MDQAILNSLGVFEAQSEAKAPPHSPPVVEQNSGRVVRTDFNTFHAAPSPLLSRVQKNEEEAEYQRGLAEGQAAAQDLHARTIDTMQRALLEVQNKFSENIAQIEASHLAVMSECFLAIAPNLAKGAMLTEMASLLKTATASALSGSVTIKCTPEDQAAIETLCESLPSGQSQSVTIKADKAHMTGNTIIEWDAGGASFDHQAIAQEFVMQVSALMPHDTIYETTTPIETEVHHDI